MSTGVLKKQLKNEKYLSHPNFEIPEPFVVEKSLNLASKSEEDISTLVKPKRKVVTVHPLSSNKSEVCLYTVSTKKCDTLNEITDAPTGLTYSQRDLNSSQRSLNKISTPRHDSVSSLCYSQTSESKLSSNSTIEATLRVPIIGYEVMEERARFTVYKLRVENPTNNESWLVLRRYTDFVRLNNRLKESFPEMNAVLPRKKIFGDNFNSAFLDDRTQGLQIYINAILARSNIRDCAIVREFFCLDEPPTRSDSMEECRAIFEAQEETIAHLKLQIENKNDVILGLQQKLREAFIEKGELQDALKNLTL